MDTPEKSRDLCKTCVQEMVAAYKFGPNRDYYKALLKNSAETPCPWCKQ